MRAWLEAQRRDPLRVATLALVLGASVFVLVWPFLQVRYPPLTDLPFHAAQVSIIRHYYDPAFHFREQFTLHPFEVPYVTMYAIGALASYVLPIGAATKVMAIAMLALLPLGLALLFHGLGKNPLWGVLGLGFAWTSLTHWGFLSFVGALGLYAASIGCALLVVARPTRRRQALLALALVGVFFTHVYRFPYAVLAAALAGLVMFPSTRRLRPLFLPIGVALALFAAWLLARPASLSPSGLALELDVARATRVGELTFGSYTGASGAVERSIAGFMVAAVAAAVVLCLVYRERGDAAAEPERRAWRRGATLLPLLLGAGHLLAYFTLPSRLGEWWYVYPRELLAAAFIALAAVPDLPRRRSVQLGVVGLLCLASGRMAGFVAGRFAAFERDTADFRAVIAELPAAPKLSYLVIDHLKTETGFWDKRHSAYVHLPAWVQAERGGWLSFHFAGWGIFPVRYRADSPDVPPAVPRDWEWNPSWFRVERDGRFFDWFLVRLADDPTSLYERDPSLELVSHRGTWWLYRRK